MKINKTKIGKIDGTKLKIAIVLPYFNDELGKKLLESAEKELLAHKVKKENIQIVRVAGALEIPFACQKVIEKYKVDGVIALGIVIRGETIHFALVSKKAYDGIMKVQIEKNTPISFGVLTCENEAQAKARINKGKDAAEALLLQLKI
jgi:6,7-dimethyl-8-ribityllumazine synthase